jgi:cellulose synthase/poly-beta-1,6-N-acetylglucosamine synthase-like glycosyltransferase
MTHDHVFQRQDEMFLPIMLTLSFALLFLVSFVLPFAVRGGRRSRGVSRDHLPENSSIEVIIPAYLEETTIGPTVDRIRRQMQGWPGGTKITVVASDEATAVAAKYADTVIITKPQGKPCAVNLGIRQSRAQVIVLTDGNTSLQPDSWPQIALRELRSSELVSGNKTETGGQDGLFWKFESKAKSFASDSSGTLAVIGEFLAFRRTDFEEIPVDIQSDDLWISMNFDSRGLRSRVSHEITAYEKAAVPKDQWERRIRIAAGQLFEALPKSSSLFRTAAGRAYLAHKMYRLTVGAAAFWGAAIACSLIHPPIMAPLVIIAVSLGIMQYRGVVNLPRPIGLLGAVVGMQVVPILGGIRAIKRYWKKNKGQKIVGWSKVPR